MRNQQYWNLQLLNYYECSLPLRYNPSPDFIAIIRITYFYNKAKKYFFQIRLQQEMKLLFKFSFCREKGSNLALTSSSFLFCRRRRCRRRRHRHVVVVVVDV